MKIDLAFPVLPPTLDGIGDHTAHLARALVAEGCTVRVLTAQEECPSLNDIGVKHAFTYPPRRGVCALADAVLANPPDWLFLQFNQFSYGRWGLNPFLPLTLRRIRQSPHGPRIAVMFHEDFVPVTNWKNAIMTTWQRGQFWMLGRQADQVFFSIDPWARRYRSWFPGTPIHHLPVGSNMPRVDADRQRVRAELGIHPDTFVLGVFGSLHHSRLIAPIRQVAVAMNEVTDQFQFLYVGPHGNRFRRALDGWPIRNAGRLPAEYVSRHLRAMDVHLTPFIDGVSTRRGSFMAGLQHGVPTVATRGPLTDSLLADRDGDAFLLAPVAASNRFAEHVMTLWQQPKRRLALGHAGQRLYDERFTFEAAAQTIMDLLCEGIATQTTDVDLSVDR
jgi:glycosyltransferase involved in cell wall biosynthesis